MRKLTTQQFIEKSQQVHGNKYDYSKTIFTTTKNKVIIICPEHGEFEQEAASHMRGINCPKCKKGLLDTHKFIEKAQKVHENKYDYSKTVYINAKTKVKIICPDHGEFECRADMHLFRTGCKKCSYEKNTLTTEEWIEKAQKVHNNRYDYSKSKYTNSSNNITIICPDHGEFEQIARNHLQGAGCPYCSNNKKLDTNLFLHKARLKHGDLYDYKLVNLNESDNSKTIINIICNEHGVFQQRMSAHIDGQGCPKCKPNYPLTTEDFIRRAQQIHGNKYSYHKVEYVNMETKIWIYCKQTDKDGYSHGDFQQLPDNHLIGKGCPKCSHQISKAEQEIFDYISSLGFNPEQSNRSILNGKEIDIYIPEKKVAIEYNGLYWHSELHRENNYHKEKVDLAKLLE